MFSSCCNWDMYDYNSLNDFTVVLNWVVKLRRRYGNSESNDWYSKSWQVNLNENGVSINVQHNSSLFGKLHQRSTMKIIGSKMQNALSIYHDISTILDNIILACEDKKWGTIFFNSNINPCVRRLCWMYMCNIVSEEVVVIANPYWSR